MPVFGVISPRVTNTSPNPRPVYLVCELQRLGACLGTSNPARQSLNGGPFCQGGTCDSEEFGAGCNALNELSPQVTHFVGADCSDTHLPGSTLASLSRSTFRGMVPRGRGFGEPKARR